MIKTALLFTISILFFAINSYSQTVQEYSTGSSTYEFKEGALIELSTGKTLFTLEDNVIKEGKSGKSLYTIVNGVLKSTASKKSLYKYKEGKISNFTSDEPLFEITDSGVIKSWSMGTGFYRINGSFGVGELYVVLLATGLL